MAILSVIWFLCGNLLLKLIMKILVLHGPNLNLIGSISAQTGERITLDKINTALRRHIRSLEVELKITQTHKVFQAINFIQRNRTWADGIIIAPMAWAHYEYSILDAINISKIPAIQLLFSNRYGSIKKEDSIFTDNCKSTIVGSPNQIYIDGIDAFQKQS